MVLTWAEPLRNNRRFEAPLRLLEREIRLNTFNRRIDRASEEN